MCEYTGNVEDSQCHINIQLTDEEVTESVKKILNESEAVYRQTGLNPFYTKNKPPDVSIIFHFTFDILVLYKLCILCPTFNRVMIRSRKGSLRRKRQSLPVLKQKPSRKPQSGRQLSASVWNWMTTRMNWKLR